MAQAKKTKRKEGTSVELYLEDVRLSYPHLWRPTTFQGDKNAKPKYQATLMVDPKKQKAVHDKILDAVDDVQEAMWDDPEYLESSKLCYVDGNKKRNGPEEYKDMWLLTAKSDRRPTVINRDKSPLTEDDDVIFPGCRVDVLVRVYALDNDWGERVNCSLEIVRYNRKDERLGAAPADPDAMPEASGEGDEEAPRRGRGRDRGGDDAPRRRSGRDAEDEAPRSRRAAAAAPADDDDGAPPRRRGAPAAEETDDPPARTRRR